MDLPLYCILNGERAVKAVRTDEGGLAVLEYYPEDDDFRGNIDLLNRIFSDDLDVKYVTAEEFNEFVDREGAKYRADPRLRRNTKIAALQRARNMVVLAVEQIDPERARRLKNEFPESVESRGPEQERNLKNEEASTRRLLEIVADLNADFVKASVRTARRIAGLFNPPGGQDFPQKTLNGAGPMKSKTVAWVFSTPAPLRLEEVLRRVGSAWTAHDSDRRRDSISGPLGRNARARIFKYGLACFVVNLTVEVEQEPELDAALREATAMLLGEVLPLFEAQEILETMPEE